MQRNREKHYIIKTVDSPLSNRSLIISWALSIWTFYCKLLWFWCLLIPFLFFISFFFIFSQFLGGRELQHSLKLIAMYKQETYWLYLPITVVVIVYWYVPDKLYNLNIPNICPYFCLRFQLHFLLINLSIYKLRTSS